MARSQNTDVATTDQVNGQVATVRASDGLAEYFQRRALATKNQVSEDGSRAYQVMADQVDKILTAETEDDIWGADEGGTTAAKDLTNVPLRVHSYDVVESGKFRTDFGVYALLTATNLVTGDDVRLNTGAGLILAKLRAFEAIGYMGGGDKGPIDVIFEGIETASGNTVLKMKQYLRAAVLASAE